jgi:hypothetical protein
LFELSGLIQVQTAVLGAPLVVRVVADANISDCLSHLLAVGNGDFDLPQLVQNLLSGN